MGCVTRRPVKEWEGDYFLMPIVGEDKERFRDYISDMYDWYYSDWEEVYGVNKDEIVEEFSKCDKWMFIDELSNWTYSSEGIETYLVIFVSGDDFLNESDEPQFGIRVRKEDKEKVIEMMKAGNFLEYEW